MAGRLSLPVQTRLLFPPASSRGLPRALLFDKSTELSGDHVFFCSVNVHSIEYLYQRSGRGCTAHLDDGVTSLESQMLQFRV